MSIRGHRAFPLPSFVACAAALWAISGTAWAQVQVLEDRLEPSGGVAFATNSPEIHESSHPTLAAIARALLDDATLRIEVQVHSDARGSSGYNLRMSQLRAEAIVAHLLRLGVPPDRLVARGYGETCPLTTGVSPGARRDNRRIVFFRLDSGSPRQCPIPPPPPPPAPDPAEQFPYPVDAQRQGQ